jgi:hypothetical protein
MSSGAAAMYLLVHPCASRYSVTVKDTVIGAAPLALPANVVTRIG